MGLFKILRGDSSRISLDVTTFHDGYAYFTPDDGKFYIDAETNGEQKRILINPNCEGGGTAVDAVLTADGWIDGQQAVTIEGITADSNGVIGLAQELTDEQLSAAKIAELRISGQSENTLIVTASAIVPVCDIPVTAILL